MAFDWKTLDPETRARAVKSAILASVAIAALLAYFLRDPPPPVEAAAETRNLTLEPTLLAEDHRSMLETEVRRRDSQIAELHDAIEAMQRELESTEADRRRSLDRPRPEPVSNRAFREPDPTERAQVTYPPPPPAPFVPPGRDKLALEPAKAEPAFVGGIVHEHLGAAAPGKEAEKKSPGRKVYLAPSFMEATLLSGLDASTVQDARDNPTPLMLRVKQPAVLPNRVKAALEGCFLIAQGYGQLASERVDTRLVSLSCVDRRGASVVDQPIKGVVMDADGKVGLKGRVYSRMGAHVARSLLAELFQGIGDAARTGAQTVSVSPLGETRSLESGNLLRAGLGAGLAGGSKGVSELFLELAKQSGPTIEVGPTKQVTAVVTEGVWLEIKDYCVGDLEACL